jgi:hypothetical protein
MMKAELAAGSWKVIAEARESGTIGIYRKDGSANTGLIDEIVRQIAVEDVLWEAPNKNQQVWFIQLLGANVNLGNIAPSEVVSLEKMLTWAILHQMKWYPSRVLDWDSGATLFLISCPNLFTIKNYDYKAIK